MMVTNPIRPVIELIDGVWCVNTPDMQKSIDKYNNSKKRFLFYPWGVWCTAYARYNLWTGIRAFGDDYIYSDTDSIKCVNADKHMDYINEYNNEITGKLLAMCKHYDIDPLLLAPKTIKGVAKPIGVWDHETADHKYLSFKSIGAKRYMILTDEGLTMTVSGVNKHIAAPYLVNKYGIDKVFDMFDEGLEIPADYTGKLTHYYIDDAKQGIIEDYQGVPFEFDESDAPSGVYLEAASYDFSMSADYINYLATIRGERIEIL